MASGVGQNPFDDQISTSSSIQGKHLQTGSNGNADNIQKKSMFKAYNIARLVLGISLACLAVGITIVYFPIASNIFFAVLGAAAIISITYLIYNACKNCKANSEVVLP